MTKAIGTVGITVFLVFLILCVGVSFIMVIRTAHDTSNLTNPETSKSFNSKGLPFQVTRVNFENKTYIVFHNQGGIYAIENHPAPLLAPNRFESVESEEKP